MIIPSKKKWSNDPYEDWLYNLEIRLKLQKEWVQRTEDEIDYVKSLIKEKKRGNGK